MTEVVLDSSAVIAVLFGEAGAERVEPLLDTALVSAVNQTEIVSRLLDRGWTEDDIQRAIDIAPYRVVDFAAGMALTAGFLRTMSRPHGLSLGDRACLALGIERSLPVVTADRAWAKLAFPVEIRLIR